MGRNRVVRTAPMWESHPAISNHEVVPRGPRICHLKLCQERPHQLFFFLISNSYVKLAPRSPTVSGAQRSHHPARTVNRNEPFGSILEVANSHFSKPLTFLRPRQGVGFGEIGAGYGCPRERLPLRDHRPERFASVSRRMDTMSFSCR